MYNKVTLTIVGGEIKPTITVPSSSTILLLKMKIMEHVGVSIERQHQSYSYSTVLIVLSENTIINEYIHVL
ncbi:hypothetical protein Ddye_002598 [Dipteronia dyeriana]|uniref:Ubiquitin-like domain-containing protein n=1 Tax=Dipteronia dyeriana TaxID=168575 RepID=A0AAD9XQQ3_9ROSI|nr:hypothetical protein Ddye_002598 [Dipteronia dyeriana]